MSGTEAEVPPCDSWEFDVLDVPPWDSWAVECPRAHHGQVPPPSGGTLLLGSEATSPSAVQAPEAGAADEPAQPQRAPHRGGRATPAWSCSRSFRGAEHPRVVLLEYRRSPRSFRDALMCGPELQESRAALQRVGLCHELPCGAKIFVRPEWFEVVVKAVRAELAAEGVDLKPRHVVVAMELESAVAAAVAPLRSERVTVKSRKEVELIAKAAKRADEGYLPWVRQPGGDSEGEGDGAGEGQAEGAGD
jgi:hypothetical protein